jgi:hypothetical protein
MPIDIGDIPTGTPPTTGEKLQIRTAIGLGQTDAPTFNSLGVTNTATANVFSTSAAALQTAGYLGVARAINLIDTAGISWSSTSTLLGATGTNLLQDAAGILAQRNGTAKQTLRIYNTYTSATVYERAVMDWNGPTPGNLQIGTEFMGSGSGMAARPIDFVIGGTARMSLSTASDLTVVGSVSTGSGFVFTSKGYIGMSSSGVMSLNNWLGNDFNRIQLGGTADTHPAIARDGAGIKFTGAATGLTSWIKVPAVTVSALPAAATAGVGARAFVNNALNPVFGNAVVGSGLSTVPVYSDGTNWNVG